MNFINWGNESDEQKNYRRFLEEQALFEQAINAGRSRGGQSPGVGGSGGVSESLAEGSIETILANLNLRYSEVTELVPDIYNFWDDYTDDEDDNPMPGINDGGDDMYDGGNYMNTNLTATWDDIKDGEIDDDDILAAASIPYTHTQADDEDDDNEYYNPPMDGVVQLGDSYFGAGSKYFTNMYPGLFIMVADNISISEFNISGNVGSDGDGVSAGYIESVVPGWTLFYKTNTDEDNEDPSINQLILVPGTSDGITQEYDDSSEDDDHRISGISDRSSLIYAVVARHPDEDVLSESDAILVAQKILEIILQ